MNFGRILNIFIVLFIVANIVLYGAYEYKNEQNYTITAEKEMQLKEILSNNNIYIYCLLPQYKPRRKMLVKLQEVDKDQLSREFFGNSYTYKPQPYQQTYQKDDEEIVVDKGGKEGVISYTNTSGAKTLKHFNKDEVEKLGKELMNKLTMEKDNMKLTSSQPDDDYNYFKLEYNHVMKNEIIFSSYVRIKIERNGYVTAESFRYEPDKFFGEKKRIYSVDEVLYKFMYNIRQKDNNELIKIMGIDIGYYVNQEDITDKSILEAEPCYRISLGSGEIHYIDAYTNKEVFYTNSTTATF